MKLWYRLSMISIIFCTHAGEHADLVSLEGQKESLAKQELDVSDQKNKLMQQESDAYQAHLQALADQATYEQLQDKTTKQAQELQKSIDQNKTKAVDLQDLQNQVEQKSNELKTIQDQRATVDASINKHQDNPVDINQAIEEATRAGARAATAFIDAQNELQRQQAVNNIVEQIQTVQETVPQKSLHVSIVDFVLSLPSTLLDALSSAFKSLALNISIAIEQTKAALSRTSAQVDAVNQDISDLEKQANSKNKDLQQLASSNVLGTKSKQLVNDLIKSTVTREEYTNIVTKGYENLYNDIANEIKTNNIASMLSNLQQNNMLASSYGQTVVDAYSQFVKALDEQQPMKIQDRVTMLVNACDVIKKANIDLNLNVQNYKLDLTMLDTLTAIGYSYDDIQTLNQQHDFRIDQRNALLDHEAILNKRGQDISVTQNNNKIILQTIDDVNFRKKFIQNLDPFYNLLNSQGIDYLRTVDFESQQTGKLAAVDEFGEQIRKLQANDIVNAEGFDDATKAQLLKNQLDLLNAYDAKIKFMLDEYNDQLKELLEEAMLEGTAAEKQTKLKAAKESYKNGLSFGILKRGDTDTYLAQLEKNDVVVPLTRYGFKGDLLVKKPDNLSGDALKTYLRDAIFNYVIGHAYDALGVPVNAKQEQILKAGDDKAALKTKGYEKAAPLEKQAEALSKSGNIQEARKIRGQAESIILAAEDAYSGPRELVQVMGTKTGRKVIDAFRINENQVDALYKAVSAQEAKENEDAGANFISFVSKLNSLVYADRGIVPLKIQEFQRALNSFK